jgi:hypothetical protein
MDDIAIRKWTPAASKGCCCLAMGRMVDSEHVACSRGGGDASLALRGPNVRLTNTTTFPINESISRLGHKLQVGRSWALRP